MVKQLKQATPTDNIVFSGSVQSRRRNQPNGTIPIGFSGVPNLQDSGLLFSIGSTIDSIPDWSVYPWARDRMLRAFYKVEPIISGAVYTLTARLSALRYTLTGRDELQDDIHQLLDDADYGNGFEVLISKTITDLATQDNGAFWELVGDGNPDGELLGGVAYGVNYLDPAQCYRTYDPEYPVLYVDPIKGTRHQIHRSRVVMFSNMPMPNELARGVGFCPLSRALLSVQLMQAIQEYRYEKTSGKFERAIGFGTGMTSQTLQGLLNQVQNEDENMGFARFGKIPFFVSPRKEVNLNLLDLASVPDGFDLMNETEVYVMTIALAFGIDARELWAATQTGATKADASIQHMKTRGKGLADLITTIERAVNQFLMPEDMKFVYDFIDDEHDAEVATTRQAKTAYLSEIKREGGLSGAQYQAMLIHEGILDENVLAEAEQIADLPEENPTDMPLPEGGNIPEPETEPDIPDFNGLFDTGKSQATMRNEMRNIIRGVVQGVFSEASAVQSTDSVVRRQLTQAAMKGIERGGLLRGDLTQAEITKLQNIIFNEQDYVVGLVKAAVAEGRKDEPRPQALFSRVDMWVNRYKMVEDTFFTMAAADKKLKWLIGDTKESCIDCTNYNGRVYRGTVWDRYDIEVKMWDLTCRGGHCDCRKVVTDEPVTPGRPPSPRGRAS